MTGNKNPLITLTRATFPPAPVALFAVTPTFLCGGTGGLYSAEFGTTAAAALDPGAIPCGGNGGGAVWSLKSTMTCYYYCYPLGQLHIRPDHNMALQFPHLPGQHHSHRPTIPFVVGTRVHRGASHSGQLDVIGIIKAGHLGQGIFRVDIVQWHRIGGDSNARV